MAVENIIEQIFKDALDIPEAETVSNDICMEDSPVWDSLAQMTIIIQLKKEFDINFLYDEILSMNTLGKIKDITEKKLR